MEQMPNAPADAQPRFYAVAPYLYMAAVVVSIISVRLYTSPLRPVAWGVAAALVLGAVLACPAVGRVRWYFLSGITAVVWSGILLLAFN